MTDLGGRGFSQVAVLAPGFSGDYWPVRFGAIPTTKSFEGWGDGKGALIASWYRCFRWMVLTSAAYN